MPEVPLPEQTEQYIPSSRVERRLSPSNLQDYHGDLLDICGWLAGRRRQPL